MIDHGQEMTTKKILQGWQKICSQDILLTFSRKVRVNESNLTWLMEESFVVTVISAMFIH